MMRFSVILILFSTAACFADVAEPPAEWTLTEVVVDNCYTGSGDFEVVLSGTEIPIDEPGARNDTVAVCSWSKVALPDEIAINVTGDLELQATVEREPGKALVISAQQEDKTVSVIFVPKDSLLYD